MGGLGQAGGGQVVAENAPRSGTVEGRTGGGPGWGRSATARTAASSESRRQRHRQRRPSHPTAWLTNCTPLPDVTSSRSSL